MKKQKTTDESSQPNFQREEDHNSEEITQIITTNANKKQEGDSRRPQID